MARGSKSGGNANNQGQTHQGRFQEWPKGTRWAYFKKLPPEAGDSSHWIRVGSPAWKKIQSINASASTPNGIRANVPQYHQTKMATQTWNPASPRGQIIYQGKASGTKTGAGQQVGNDPGRGGEMGAKQRGTAGMQTAGPGRGNGSGNGTSNKTKQQQIKALNAIIGGANNQQMLDPSFADALAGMQFDGQIHDVQAQQQYQTAQGAQDLADISNWYGQVGQANTAAQQLMKQVSQRVAGADQNAASQAIGGSPVTAALGAQTTADANSVGANADMYRSILGPLLQNAQAQQMSAQQALNSQGQMQLQQQLQDLIGQRGQAKAQALMQIIQQNNAGRQQDFSNRLAKLQATLGARQLLGNLKLQNFQINQAQQASGGGGHTHWVNLTADQKYQQALQLMQGPNNSTVPLKTALARATALGYDAALVRPYLTSFYG